MSTHVTYETNHIYDSTMSSALNFCFYVFFCNLKENNQIRRNINNKKKKYMRNHYYYYFDLLKLGLFGPVLQNINLPYLNMK